MDPITITGTRRRLRGAGDNGQMLDYAWRVVRTRTSVWVPVAGCALLAAIPGTLIAIFFALPATVLLLGGDPGLALELSPGPFDRPLIAASGALVALTGGLALWSRLYAAAVWASDDRNDAGVLTAFRASRGAWADVFVLYASVYCVLIIAAAVTAVTLIAAGDTSTALALGLVSGSVLLAGRVALRVALTLAIRSAVLEGTRAKQSWGRAIAVLRERRRDAIALWVALVAAGAVVWIGGRLIAPILQETALDFPTGSAYVAYREIAQLVLAVPLEAFLLTLSIGVWTALYLGRDERAPRDTAPREKRGTDPWVLRALAVLVLLTIVANGIPTLLEDRLRAGIATEESAIRAVEMDPEDALRSALAARRGTATSYDVTAVLDDGQLTWTTRIGYRNRTDDVLEDLGLHLYPAAYTRDLEDIPLAEEILRADISGRIRSSARPGTFALRRVRVGTERARFSRDETELIVDLPRPVDAGDRIEMEITLAARLPEFPERFGSWGDTILLGNWIPTIAARNEDNWDLEGFPSTGDPFASEAANYRVSIEADETISLVGSGVLDSVEQTDPGTKTWHFSAPGARDAAFVASPALRGLERRVGSLTVRSWYPAHRTIDGREQLDTATAAAADYQRRFGSLAFDEIDVVATPGFLGGMEYPGVVFVSDPSTALTDIPLLPELYRHAGLQSAGTRYMIAHEVAHQWWYASVGNDQQRQPWLDEAFAEVSTRLWLRSSEGNDRTWQMVYMMSDAAPRQVVDNSAGDFDSNDAYSDAVYVAGAEVLLELRERVGAREFDRILALWHERARLRIATIDEFIATVEDEAGHQAADIIRRYR